jgi:hypothetical protein
MEELNALWAKSIGRKEQAEQSIFGEHRCRNLATLSTSLRGEPPRRTLEISLARVETAFHHFILAGRSRGRAAPHGDRGEHGRMGESFEGDHR